MPIPFPLMAAGGAVAGGLFKTGMDMFLADKSRDFNREMASTQHQRQVADLRKSGLNPILSAHGGGTAVAPSPTPQAPDIDVFSKASQGLQLASSLALQNAQIRDINASASGKELEYKVNQRTYQEKIDTIRETLGKLRNEVDLQPAQREKIDAEIKNLGIQSELLESESAHSAYGLSKSRSESRFYEGAGGDIEHWLKMLGIQMPGISIFRSGKGRPTRRRSTTTTKSGNRTDVESVEYDLPRKGGR